MILFSPFIVTGFKNKKESRNFSTSRPRSTALWLGRRVELNEKKFNPLRAAKQPWVGLRPISEEFLFWFSGFTDGEGNFSITLDRGYIRFRFKINERNSKGSFTKSNPISKINQVNSVRYYTTSSTNLTNLNLATKYLNPNLVTGFVDAEGSFSIRVYEQAGKTGWGVLPSFNLHLHSKDLPLLYSIRYFFGVGRVFCYEDEKSAKYIVSKMSDLTNVIIPHFEKISFT